MTKSTKIGTDLDTPDTVRTSLARETALHMARVYKRTLYPRPLELSLQVDEVIVEVRVRTVEGNAASTPRRRATDVPRSAEQYSYE